ncbi:MAG: VanW family protein [Rubrobacteraceae bacterium]
MRQVNKRKTPRFSNSYEHREASGRRSSRRAFAWRGKLPALVLIAGLLLVATLTLAWSTGEEKIRRGVHVGDLALGGMTQAVARETLTQKASGDFDEVSFGGDEGFTLTGEELGLELDAVSTVEEAYAVGRGGWFGKRFFDGKEVAPIFTYDKEAARKALEDSASQVRKEPRDASFNVKDGEVKIQAAKDGSILNPEGTLANLDRALADFSADVEIATKPVQPSVADRDLQGLKPTKLLGEYQTDFAYDSNPSRQKNMKLSAGAVNETVLAPGEVFSFNELAAPLEYESAKVYAEGGVALADGGGLCQVSSTLYMAAQYAGLEIVERNAHYAVLPYIRPGFDATVWFGDENSPELDMQFENTTDGYVLVREYVDDEGFMNAEIWGRPTGKEVEMRSEKIFEDLQRGIKWVTYKTVEQDGEVLYDGLIHEDLYSFNPPPPEGAPSYDTTAPRIGGWEDPTNTTGWADVE